MVKTRTRCLNVGDEFVFMTHRDPQATFVVDYVAKNVGFIIVRLKGTDLERVVYYNIIPSVMRL